MRRTLIFVASYLSLAGLAPQPDGAPEPVFVDIVGACTSPAPRVAPARVTVSGVDEVVWRDRSGQAERFTVEPKEDGAWPFAEERLTAVRGETAASGPPADSTLGGQPVLQGQVYPYRLTLGCPGGAQHVIEAEVVIGEV